MSPFALLAALYGFFSTRRLILYTVTLGIVVISITAFKNIELSEDMQGMLPEKPSQVADDFRLLQEAPFVRKILINVKGTETTTREELIHTVDRLKQAMGPPFFTEAISGPPMAPGRAFFSLLEKALPNTISQKDTERILARLNPQGVRASLREIYNRILVPEAWGSKELLRKDPLQLLQIALGKFRYLSTVPKMRLVENHFMSADGKNALIMADTPVKITDSEGAEALLHHFKDLVDERVPPQIKVSLLSAHRYAAANAAAVKGDLVVILSCSSLAILALFLVYLRTWGGFFVFLVPVSVLCLASVGVSLVFDTVSAVTIGFGSVLLGISVDFALHVYFALRYGKSNPASIVAEVSRPVLFGGLTSLVAFGVLLLSDLPAQRQLAVFSMTGIGAALIISLVTLPHLIRAGAGGNGSFGARSPIGSALSPRWILVGWLVLLGLAAWQATHLRFDGDLRSLNLVPKDIRETERLMQETWGNLRGRAILFAEGDDLQSALETNDRLFSYLGLRMNDQQITSLAPILPSLATQQVNRDRWKAFWAGDNGKLARRLFENEGRALGFSDDAFSPFFENLSDPPPGITPEDLRAAGLGGGMDSFISFSHNRVRILTLVPDSPETIAIVAALPARLKGVRWVSQAGFGDMISKALGRDFLQFILGAFLVVVMLLGILFHDLKKVLWALIPVVTGLTCMFGGMGFLNIPFNLFNIVATVLIIGLGVDYGIFMVCRHSEGYKHTTERAVLVSGLTTLAGFGALVLARHPALHSIGVTVLFGIGIAIPTALLVIPALYRKKRGTL